jgi:hypothetical protein
MKICDDIGVKLVYLPLYSPDINPIREFFAELEAFIKRHGQIYVDDPEQGFDTFLEWCIDVVGGNKRSARGYFSHARLKIEEPLSPSTAGVRSSRQSRLAKRCLVI